MALWTKQGGTWQEVESADLKVKQSNSWQLVKKGYVKNNGSWKQVYVGSDPKTYTFWATQTGAGSGTAWKTSSNPYGPSIPTIGRYYDTTRYPWYGLAQFYQDTSGVPLATRLAERPVVKAATFTVYRYTAGGNNSADGYNTRIYIARYMGNFSDSNPSNLNCNFTYWGARYWNNPAYLNRDESTGPINLFANQATAQALVQHAVSKPLCMSTTTNNGGGSGGLGDYATGSWEEGYNYWHFYNAGANYLGAPLGPVLTVTLDYV